MRALMTDRPSAQTHSQLTSFSVEKRIDRGRNRGEVGFVVNVIYANEADPQAEEDLDRLLASLLRKKPCSN